MKKLSLSLTLSLLALISSGTLVKADSVVDNANQSQDPNYLIMSNGDIEIEGLEDVQPEEIQVMTSEAYEVDEVYELELLEEIAEVSPTIE